MSVNVQKRWSTDQLITGIEIQDWLKLLGDNRYRVDPTYLHRAAFVGSLAVGSSIASRIEDMRFGRQLASIEIDVDAPTPQQAAKEAWRILAAPDAMLPVVNIQNQCVSELVDLQELFNESDEMNHIDWLASSE